MKNILMMAAIFSFLASCELVDDPPVSTESTATLIQTNNEAFFSKSPKCDLDEGDPLRPDNCDKGGGGGDGGDTGDGSWTFAEAVYHDDDPPSEGRPPHWLISNCVADNSRTGGSLNLVWPRHLQCANITPIDTKDIDRCSDMTPDDEYVTPLLKDDPTLTVSKKKGMITSVQFYQQDKIGADGIAYKSEVVTIVPAVPFTGAGTLLHIDQNVWVWRLKGHTGGPQVKRVGCMHIADIAYRE